MSPKNLNFCTQSGCLARYWTAIYINWILKGIKADQNQNTEWMPWDVVYQGVPLVKEVHGNCGKGIPWNDNWIPSGTMSNCDLFFLIY